MVHLTAVNEGCDQCIVGIAELHIQDEERKPMPNKCQQRKERDRINKESEKKGRIRYKTGRSDGEPGYVDTRVDGLRD